MRQNYKMLVTDVDGVLTDGTKIYTPEGILGKRFFERDFTAMKMFIEKGIHVVCITSDPLNVSCLAVKSHKISVVVGDNRVQDIKRVAGAHRLRSLKNVIYIGDDIYDQECLSLVAEQGGLACIPANANKNIKLPTYHEINRDGGSGVLEELYWEMFH